MDGDLTGPPEPKQDSAGRLGSVTSVSLVACWTSTPRSWIAQVGPRLSRPVRDLDLGAHRPGAACADAPRWGITYARFRFSGCPSRWRSQRGRTVRQ